MSFIAEDRSPHTFVDNAAPIHEDCSTDRPALRILFVALVNNVGCERVMTEMSSHGALCALMCPPNYYCTKQAALSRYFSLPETGSVWITSLFVRRRLDAATRDWGPDLVIPLDDISAWLLRSLAMNPWTRQPLRDLLVKSLGAPSGYSAATRRRDLMEVASRLGLRKPMHWQISTPAGELQSVSGASFPMFIKTDHSCGGDGVTAVNDATDLQRKLAARGGGALRGRLTTWARSLLRSLAGFRGGADEAVLVQSFAPGIPAFRTVAALNGRVLAGISFAAERIHPEPTGASTVIRFVENKEMEEAATAMTAALGCSGFVSYDFMLDEEQGQATLIEMNPRCVGSCHLGGFFGQDLCGSLVAELTGSTISRPPGGPNASAPKLIALFPKELQRDPDSPYLRSPDVLHDVPSNEPDLVSSYMSLLGRLYPARAGSIRRIIEDQLGRPLLLVEAK